MSNPAVFVPPSKPQVVLALGRIVATRGALDAMALLSAAFVEQALAARHQQAGKLRNSAPICCAI